MNAPEKLNPFEQLAAINVSSHIEKKNGLSYLSWAWAVDQLLRADPNANWEYHDPAKFGKDTWMVSCTVTAFNTPRRMFLPVMDHRNKAISDPDAFQFNTAMMRCLVKAIALHGLGLYIYAGEDLPLGEEPSKEAAPMPRGTITPTTGVWDALDDENKAFLTSVAMDVIALLDEGRIDEAVVHINKQNLDNDDKIALWTRFDSKQRSAMKKAAKPTAEEFANTP